MLNFTIVTEVMQKSFDTYSPPLSDRNRFTAWFSKLSRCTFNPVRFSTRLTNSLNLASTSDFCLIMQTVVYLDKLSITVTKFLEPTTEGTSIGPQTLLWISSSNPVMILCAFLGKGWRCCLPIAHPSNFRSTASLESKLSPYTIPVLFKSFRLLYHTWPYRWCHSSRGLWLLVFPIQQVLSGMVVFSLQSLTCFWLMVHCFPSMVILHALPLNSTATRFFVIDGREKSLFWSFGTKNTSLKTMLILSLPFNIVKYTLTLPYA